MSRRLVDDRDVALVGRIDPVLRQRRVELELVAAAPDADLFLAHLLDRRDARVLVRQLGHAAAREDLRDVDEVAALVACRQEAWEPVDPELGLAARHDLLGRDVRPADLQRDVQAVLVVVALLLRRVVAGELRLRHPLELERDVVLLRAARASGRARGRPA